MNSTDAYDQISLKVINRVDCLGSFEVSGRGVSMGSSTARDVVISWSGSIANGSGAHGDPLPLECG